MKFSRPSFFKRPFRLPSQISNFSSEKIPVIKDFLHYAGVPLLFALRRTGAGVVPGSGARYSPPLPFVLEKDVSPATAAGRGPAPDQQPQQAAPAREGLSRGCHEDSGCRCLDGGPDGRAPARGRQDPGLLRCACGRRLP